MCKICSKNYLKRVDCIKTWSGRCLSCAGSIKTKGTIRVPRNSCKLCGKTSYWIKLEPFLCKACYTKNPIKGEDHYKWKADRTTLANRQERNDMAYKEWRKQVRVRDGFMCKMQNGDCNGKIEAHHILSWKEYPELRYQINNGITLCHAHHPRKRAEEKRLAPVFTKLVSVSK